MEYRVELDTFRGPLDLLLYLVKRNEVDICDIPIAKITDQFLDYIEIIQAIDFEWAGEFLVLAATLMEIKSKMLLPRAEEQADADEDDPRSELVRQLLEYKKFKDATRILDEKAQERLRRVARQPTDLPGRLAPDEQPIQKVEIWDLVTAFDRLMQEVKALTPQAIVIDETPLHVVMAEILDRLATRGPATLSQLFTPPKTRGRLLSLFLALLELIKTRRIIAEQTSPFDDITLRISGGG